MVPLRPRGSGPPLFLVHPIEGTLTGYAALVPQLGREPPVWGLRAAGLEEDEAPLSSIETMATRYLDAVRAVQPAGPYRLGGWSMGGLIAYEMARQLSEEGERVEFLAVIDQRPVARPDGGLVERLRQFPMSWETLLESADDARLAALLRQAAPYVPPGVDESVPPRQLRVYLRNALAIHRYAPRLAPLRVWLYRAGSSVADDDPSLGWAAFARAGVEVRTLPGDHHSLMRPPHVAALADAIRSDLTASTSR